MKEYKTECKPNIKYQIETPEGFVDFFGVGKIVEKRNLIKFTLEDKSTIKVTFDHTFIIDGIEVTAKDLIVGDCLESKNGIQKITKVKYLKKKEVTYTPLQVQSSNNSYYANDIVNKNCKFLGSSNTLIDSDVLEKAMFEEPIDVKFGGLMLIYEHPVAGAHYIISGDPSKGTGKDYSVCQVLRCDNQKDVTQVAVYRNNLIAPRDFAQVCISISEYYNNSYIMIENNDIGSTVCEVIWYTYECDRLLNIDPKGLGIRSTKKTKLDANMLLKEYMERGYLKVVDKRTLDELGMYEEVGTSLRDNVFAVNGDNDDCVTSLLWALYYLKTDYYSGKRKEESGQIDNEFKINRQNDIRNSIDKPDNNDVGDGEPPVIFFNED